MVQICSGEVCLFKLRSAQVSSPQVAFAQIGSLQVAMRSPSRDDCPNRAPFAIDLRAVVEDSFMQRGIGFITASTYLISVSWRGTPRGRAG